MFNLSNEQQDIKKTAREFAEGEFTDIAAECDEKELFPAGVWAKACENGFVGLFIDESYDGAGLGMLEYALIMEEFWRVDPGCGNLLLSTIGVEFIQDYGSEGQKRKFLSPSTKGRLVIGTVADEDYIHNGYEYVKKNGGQYELNGSSSFMLNGTTADYLVVVARESSKDASKTGGLSTFIIEKGQKGVRSNQLRDKLGVRACDISEVTLEGAVVGPENLVGKEGQGSDQFNGFLSKLCIYNSAQAIGVSQGCLEKAVKYSRQRVQFGHPIGWYEMMQYKIGEMATRIEAARNLCYKAAWEFDHGRVDRQALSMASWFSRETAEYVVAETLQIHGGYGYMKELDIERFYRDVQFLDFFGPSREKEKIRVARELLGSLG